MVHIAGNPNRMLRSPNNKHPSVDDRKPALPCIDFKYQKHGNSGSIVNKKKKQIHMCIYIYIDVYMYYARIPMLLVYEVYTRSCRISMISRSSDALLRPSKARPEARLSPDMASLRVEEGFRAEGAKLV